MPNKFKDIFSNEIFGLNGQIRFETPAAYQEFLKKLQIVNDNGEAFVVDGVAEITTNISNGRMEYPLMGPLAPTRVVIGPSVEDVPIEVETDLEPKTIVLRRYYITDKTILQTEEHSITYLRLEFVHSNRIVALTYKSQFQYAKTIHDIIESIRAILGLFDKLLQNKIHDILREDNDLAEMFRYFLTSKKFFERLLAIEKECGIRFEPNRINDSADDMKDAEELYFLLCKKSVIRLNGRLSSNDSTAITMNAEAEGPDVGSQLDLTFTTKVEYRILSQTITIYWAGLLSNAVVKEIHEQPDGTKKYLYSDTDSKPMHISYRGFKTMTEAAKEMEQIIENKEQYTNARTVRAYLEMENQENSIIPPM